MSATFTILVDGTIEGGRVETEDPELVSFKEVLGFRDEDIKHAFDDAIKFFNETYSLDFYQSQPNDRNELMFENSIMRVVRKRDDLDFTLVSNNWIMTGNTHMSCGNVDFVEFQVISPGDQLLYGSYGGRAGQTFGNNVFYGYFKIDVCAQSPVIVQFQTATPPRFEPIDGLLTLNFDVYNKVLGYGKVLGLYMLTPEPDNSGMNHVMVNLGFMFPTK